VATGEYKLFEEIWEERPHRCSVCGKPLPVFNVRYFAHVLGKKAYPHLRLFKGNIAILCGICHRLFDDYPHQVKDKEAWKWLFDLKERLKYGEKS